MSSWNPLRTCLGLNSCRVFCLCVMSHQHAVFWSASAAWVLGTGVCAGFCFQCVSLCSSVTLRVSPYTQYPWSMKGRCSRLPLWEAIVLETVSYSPRPLLWWHPEPETRRMFSRLLHVGELLERSWSFHFFTPHLHQSWIFTRYHVWLDHGNPTRFFLLNCSFGVIGWEKDLWSTEARPSLRYC